MVAKSRSAKHKPASDRDPILDAALALAEESGWASVGLRKLAELTRMPLAELHDVYRDTDAIADAWFTRATLHPPLSTLLAFCSVFARRCSRAALFPRGAVCHYR